MLIAILLAGVVFYESFVALKTLANVRSIQSTLSGSFAVVRSASMSDEEKAATLQRSSATMMGSVAMTAAKIVVAAAASAALLLLISFFAWPLHALIAYSVTPGALIAALAFLTLYGFLRHGRRKR